MKIKTKLKRLIDKWYSKQIDCLDIKKEKESKAELLAEVCKILEEKETK